MMDKTHRKILSNAIKTIHELRNLEYDILLVGPDDRERKMLSKNIYDIDQAVSLLNRILNR
jgi:hypothetical protein